MSGPGVDADASWRPVAERTRLALQYLNFSIEGACLPGEADACGGTFAQHAMAHLATLRAVVDDQISHLGTAAGPHVETIYQETRRKLSADWCGNPDHGSPS
jgi:hypothetical protein